MKKITLIIVLLLIVNISLYSDLTDDLEDCIGYYIHSSYSLYDNITGSVNGVQLELGDYNIEITDYGYVYAYYPTIILLYNPKYESIKIVIEDEIFDAKFIY